MGLNLGNAQNVYDKLEGSFVNYNGEWFIACTAYNRVVGSPPSNSNLHLYSPTFSEGGLADFKTKVHTNVQHDSPDLIYRQMFRLCYINKELAHGRNQAVLLTRQSGTKASPYNRRSLVGNNLGSGGFSDRGSNMSVTDENVYSALKGDGYFKWQQACAKVKANEAISGAISRYFAIARLGSWMVLYYRLTPIASKAFSSKPNVQFTLSSDALATIYYKVLEKEGIRDAVV